LFLKTAYNNGIDRYFFNHRNNTKLLTNTLFNDIMLTETVGMETVNTCQRSGQRP